MGEGCSRGKGEAERSGKANGTWLWGSSKMSFYHLKPWRRWREKGTPSSDLFPHGYLRQHPHQGCPCPGWMRSEQGRWEAGKGQNVRLAQLPPMGLSEAWGSGNVHLLHPPQVDSPEGKGTMVTHGPLHRSHKRKWAVGHACLGVTHTSIISQGSLRQTLIATESHKDPSQKPWKLSSTKRNPVTWTEEGHRECQLLSTSCLLGVREFVLKNWMLALFSISRESWSPGGKAYHSTAKLRTQSKYSTRVELWPKTGKNKISIQRGKSE